MEIRNFYILLKKHRATLFIIPLIIMVITFLVLRTMPNTYRSRTQIATGIVDQSQQVLDKGNGSQDSKATEEFTNLIETMKLDEVVDQVSFELFLHDLTQPVPFKQSSLRYMQSLSPDLKDQVVGILQKKLDSFQTLDLNVPIENKIDSMLVKTEYDHESLLKNISIYRVENSDFINLDVDAESPKLSAFIANNLTDRFSTYYTRYVSSGHSRANEFYQKLMLDKKNAMDAKMNALEAFKVKNGILDISDESKDVYTQISDLENHQQEAQKDVIAYSGALKNIDSKFDPKDRQYLEANTSKINANILNTKAKLRVLNDKYVQSNFNPVYKSSIDSLQDVLAEQINESSDALIVNPQSTKDNLVDDKLKMETNLELARYSAGSLKSQLDSLKTRINTLLPAEAAVKSYERDIDIATKEYLDAQDKYNQSVVSSIAPVELRQLQLAMPGSVQSSKKLLIIILAGIISLILYVIVLLIMFYTNNRIQSGEDLLRMTGIKVMGFLNIVPNAFINHQKPINEIKENNEMQIYRDLLRSIRFEIDQSLNGGKVLAVTSLNEGEGKTLFSLSLAYAYSLANKKVLLIDGNFSNPAISNTAKSKGFLEDYFKSDQFFGFESKEEDKEENNEDEVVDDTVVEPVETTKEMRLLEIDNTTHIGRAIQRLNAPSSTLPGSNELISVMGNRGGDISIMEINDEESIRRIMNELKLFFDIIIIEAGSLNRLNKPKEWMLIADKAIAVFENGQALDETSTPSINYLRSLDGEMLGWVLNKVDIKNVTV
jgi:succinoglycan biosynthesis transport protein ExoP